MKPNMRRAMPATRLSIDRDKPVVDLADYTTTGGQIAIVGGVGLAQ